MSDFREHMTKRFMKIGGGGLKIFATIIVLLVNFNTIVLENGILKLNGYTGETLVDAMNGDSALTTLVGVASIVRLLSGLAVPIFAFLLVEGFIHTKSKAKYFGAMAITALVSEFAYDFAMSGALLELDRQNPMIAMTVGLAMLCVMQLLEDKAAVEKWILRIILTICGLFWVTSMNVENGVEIVLLVAVFYCFREKLFIKTALGVVVSLLDPLGPFAFCALVYYNGSRKLRLNKYVYYALYPLHLIIFSLIARVFLYLNCNCKMDT